MHIAGGLYRELCDIPFWDATLGSGGRAAVAIAGKCPSVELHTYASSADKPTLVALRSQGIKLNISLRPSPIAFAYFHSLSVPHVQPVYSDIERQASITVTGDAVLRFGFLEGDAVVIANKAVYDPQTWRNPAAFTANGSKANELALVLNELELQHASGITELEQAAEHLIRVQDAAVVVVKRGTRGASVYERSGQVSYVPAYRSSTVFKIGTGDVFSALFALHWAERGLCAAKAADLASRSVSMYCATRTYDFNKRVMLELQPVSSAVGAVIHLEGSAQSLGQRFALEEARYALGQLGMEVYCPELEVDSSVRNADAVLVIDDDLREDALSRIALAYTSAIPVVTLHERISTKLSIPESTWITDDFTTAMYLAAWSAGDRLAADERREQ
ncbi:carbohydrate kinase family protein [Pseudomonas veronii]|uniref:carbohydrate kinase family protein n=1 Tax=Pseudomonas veronii TaxID=76761 RepID=UPI0009A543B7|nr:carbohydrate kinase family protein [Pseudomonas veronii]AQY66456.1 nucleoside 2-deoxyribosyltransferase [Pseudomonas veronii]